MLFYVSSALMNNVSSLFVALLILFCENLLCKVIYFVAQIFGDGFHKCQQWYKLVESHVGGNYGKIIWYLKCGYNLLEGADLSPNPATNNFTIPIKLALVAKGRSNTGGTKIS